MLEQYPQYTFPGTNIHLVTFFIIVFESAILFYQTISYLSRPRDKDRFRFLLLLVLLIQNNIVSGVFPDHRIHLPVYVQLIFGFGSSVLMSMYIPYYVYNFLHLFKSKFLVYWGVLLFLFIPYIFLFVIPCIVTKDPLFAGKLFVGPTIVYCIICLYKLTSDIRKRFKEEKDKNFRQKAIGIYIAVLFWMSMPFVPLFNLQQLVEHLLTNTGFFVLIVIFIRSNVYDSKMEYDKLLRSENELQKNNELLTQKVKERTKELELSNEQKINTFINLAHEIRTPITLINNYLEEYLNKHGDSEEIHIIKSNIEKLNADIVNSFNEERFLKGLQPIYNHDQVVDFTVLLTSKLALFKQYAQNKKIILKEVIENNLYIKADPDALNSLINNLAENAIKYTPEGGSIMVSLMKDHNQIQFSVKDTGYGIPEKMQEKIFEPYFRIDREKLNIQGMGMGLSIVNNIVKSLQGSTLVKSKENEGSEFIITLKSHLVVNNDSVTTYEPKTLLKIDGNTNKIEDAIGDKKHSIFIIEDNAEMLLYLRNKLKTKYNIYVAENGKAALEKLTDFNNKPDLFISDVMMGEMDGFAFIKAIADNPNYNYIPLIFLTAKATDADKLQGLTLGAIDYINKPFSINELTSKVDSIINNSQKQKKALLNAAAELISNLNSSNQQTVTNKNNFDDNCKTYNLSDREKEIVKLIAEDITYREISEKLNLSENTLVKHRQNIFKKVKVNKKTDLLNKLFE